MDRLTSMAVFVRTADLGSFAAAGEALGMSAQMVAKHIVALEDRLATALIQRTTRRHRLTDIGRAYYERCKTILAEAQAAEELAQDMHTKPRGTLRVSAPVTFGSFSLAPFIARFLAVHDEMQVDLSLSDRYIDPLEDGFEALIRIGDIDDASLIGHRLAPYRLIACAAPDYIARRGMPRLPADLHQHDCLTYANWSPSLPCRWLFSRDGKAEEVQVNGRLRSNDWRVLLHASLQGQGIILGPESILGAEIRSGRLAQVLPDHEGPKRPMHLLYPAGGRPTAKLRCFVDAMLAEFGPHA